MFPADDRSSQMNFPARLVQAALNARVGQWAPSPGDVASRDLARYYAILKGELDSVQLSEAEACGLCEVLSSPGIDPALARMLWWLLEESFEDGVPEKWGFDGPALVERLRHMPWSRLMAIADAVERWWILVSADHSLEHETSLRRVGLLRDDQTPLTPA